MNGLEVGDYCSLKIQKWMLTGEGKGRAHEIGTVVKVIRYWTPLGATESVTVTTLHGCAFEIDPQSLRKLRPLELLALQSVETKHAPKG